MKQGRRHAQSFETGTPDAAVRPCDVPGCLGTGLHRAPKGRQQLGQYYWFCLDHVREYNRRWDFCAGMSEREIEAMIRSDATWQRPTWPIGNWTTLETDLRSRFRHEFADACFETHGPGRGRFNGAHRDDPGPTGEPSPERRAMQVLELEEPVSFAEIKARYRDLVKQHHPDVNGGSKSSEEKLKAINEAYTTLKASHHDS